MSWLSETLNSLMSERGMTPEMLARQMGLERSRMNNILAGSAVPNGSLVRRLALHFGSDPIEWEKNAGLRESEKTTIVEVPADFFKVARVEDVPEGEMVMAYNNLVAVAHAEGQFYAFGNVCPHARGPIAEGFLEGCIVECPWHAGRWDVRTGQALTLLATADVPLFECRVVGGDIEVKLTEAVLKQGALASTPS